MEAEPVGIPVDPSLQRISIVSTLADQISDLPKPCLMSAEDVALATSPAEIDFFANYATANQMLTSLIEYEGKLQRSFENPKQTTIHRVKSRNDMADFMRMTEQIHELVCLPEEEPDELLQHEAQVFNEGTSFLDLMGFNTQKPLAIMGFHLVHPLARPNEFNGAISEIVHLTHAAQLAFAVEPDYTLIPIPSCALIQYKNERMRLWYNMKKHEETEIQALQQSLTYFLNLCWKVMTKASEVLGAQMPIEKFEDMNLSPLIANAALESQWNSIAQKLINVAKFFAFALQEKCRHPAILESPEDVPDLLIIDENGSGVPL